MVYVIICAGDGKTWKYLGDLQERQPLWSLKGKSMREDEDTQLNKVAFKMDFLGARCKMDFQNVGNRYKTLGILGTNPNTSEHNKKACEQRK